MKQRQLVIGLLVVLVLSIWFLAVDRSWFVEKCPACGYRRDVIQVRVFSLPIHQQTDDLVTLLQKIAVDVGVECEHRNRTRFHKHRYWGLWICAYPCINGTDGIVADISWYDEVAAAKVREMVRINPSLRDEFAERVLKNHDWEFWRSFVERVKAQ